MTVKPIFQIGHLERLPLGTSYPAIVAHVRRLLGKLPARTELVIDFTGVGRPVFDMFTDAGISPVGVLITGGVAETWEGAICGVPKLTLVSRLQALLHEGRLKIQKELAEAETLVRELQDFRVEFTPVGHLTFNARSGKHDDLVLALAIAVWRAHGDSYFEWMRSRTMGAAANEARYFVGVDLGQSRDPTAIAVVRRTDPVGEPAGPIYARGSIEWQRLQEGTEGLPPARPSGAGEEGVRTERRATSSRSRRAVPSRKQRVGIAAMVRLER